MAKAGGIDAFHFSALKGRVIITAHQFYFIP